MIEAQKTLPKTQCLELSYDNFVSDPESNIGRLKQFCDIEDLAHPKIIQKEENNRIPMTDWVFEDFDLQGSYEKCLLHLADLELTLKVKTLGTEEI